MKRLLAIAGLLTLISCEDIRREESRVMTEPAKVVSVVFTPGFHSSDVHPTIDFDGNIGIGISSVSVPDKYGIVFQCQHGKFFIKSRELYNRLTLGQDVVVSYKEIYRCRYEDAMVKERVLVDYDFLDAR